MNIYPTIFAIAALIFVFPFGAFLVWLACTDDTFGPTQPPARVDPPLPPPPGFDAFFVPEPPPPPPVRYLDRPYPHRTYPGEPFDLG